MKYKRRYFTLILILLFLAVGFMYIIYSEKRSADKTRIELEKIVEQELKERNLTNEELTEQILEE